MIYSFKFTDVSNDMENKKRNIYFIIQIARNLIIGQMKISKDGGNNKNQEKTN
jgi:hypothetical protein